MEMHADLVLGGLVLRANRASPAFRGHTNGYRNGRQPPRLSDISNLPLRGTIPAGRIRYPRSREKILLDFGC